MPEITHHGPVYQQLLDQKDITGEIPCKNIDTLLSPRGPDVKKCITYFIGRNYARWTSDKKTAFTLTADGKAAYMVWFAKPDPDDKGRPKGDFL